MPPEDERSYHPDMKDKDPTNGLICFLDGTRSCGADCMSYTNPPMAKGPDYDGKQWANCLLLVAVHQGGKHAAVIASTLIQLRRAQTTPGIPQVK